MNNNFADNTTLTRIQELCNKRNWSIYKLAKEADIPYSSLNNIFIRNTHPTVPTLEKICNGFGITLSEFFHEEVPTNIRCRFLTLDESETLLLETFRSLNSSDKELLLTYSKGLAKKL